MKDSLFINFVILLLAIATIGAVTSNRNEINKLKETLKQEE